jgi:hypothetical protein
MDVHVVLSIARIAQLLLPLLLQPQAEMLRQVLGLALRCLPSQIHWHSEHHALWQQQ